MRPVALRRELARLLDRLGLAADPEAPREIAVVIALRDGIPLRDALERLGVDTAPLDLPPPPESVPFARIASGEAFAWKDHVWTRAALHEALVATPDRACHPHVVAAYLAATQRGRAATAFRWISDGEAPEATCVAERVESDEPVIPVVSMLPPTAAPFEHTWTSMADQSPEVGRAVTVDTPAGPIVARLILADEAAGGAVWHTAAGDRLDIDEVSHWRSEP